MMDLTPENLRASIGRPRSASIGSIDITDSAPKKSVSIGHLRDVRRRYPQGHREAAVLPNPDNGHMRTDLIEKLFLSSERPAVALFAISICLIGVMDFIPQKAHDPNSWSDKLEDVSSFYGPGAIISWCLLSVSMLYDANQTFKREPDNFHYLKYASLIFSGVWALGATVWRALRTDFGPSYAAALYMSDKGFELATLLYTLHLFPVHRRHSTRTAKKLQMQPLDEERPEQPQSLPSHAAAAIAQYKIYPCIAMVSVWVWCRALSNGHTVYNIHAQNPHGVTISWKPLLAWYWKPVLAVLCFGLSSLVSLLTSWEWWSWSLPVGILSSFSILHSGLFGTFTPLKLTSVEISAEDQLAALLTTVLFLVLQYGRKVPFVKKAGTELTKLMIKNM